MNTKHRTLWSRIFAANAATPGPLPGMVLEAAPSIGLASSMRPLALEQRFMFDAAAGVDLAHAAVDAAAHVPEAKADVLHAPMVDAAASAASAQRNEVLFMVDSVNNAAYLLASVLPGIEVVVLDGSRDGVKQMAQYLQGRSGLDAIHIISHGAHWQVQLGTPSLELFSMGSNYAAELAAIGASLTADGDILLYGSRIAEDYQSPAILSWLRTYTGADVAASSNATGATSLGGDWVLERRSGSIEAGLPFDEGRLAGYNALLSSLATVTTFNDMSGQWFNQRSDILGTGWDVSVENLPSSATGMISFWDFGWGTDSGLWLQYVNDPAPDMVRLASHSGERFDLQSMLLFTQLDRATSGTLTITGYRDGVAVAGAIKTVSFDGHNPQQVDFSDDFVDINSFVVRGDASTYSLLIDNIEVAVGPPILRITGLEKASDSGISDSDGITNIRRPWITGTAPPSSTITLYDAGAVIGTGTADAKGVWRIQSLDLVPGMHSLTAKAGGNVSADLRILIQAAPGAPSNAIALVAASDSGNSSSDGLTNVTGPTVRIFLAGTSATVDNSVQLLLDDQVVGVPRKIDATDLRNGYVEFGLASGSLGTDGTKVLTARLTDAAGNMGAAGGRFTFTLDTTAPVAPPTPVLDPSSETGVSISDGITSVATPLITGTAEAGSTVTLYDTDGTTALGTAIATHGVWSIRSTTLSAGMHSLTTQATDAAGNVSAASAALRIVIDTSAPTAPPTPVLDALSDSGTSDFDGITSVTTPLITGTAEAGSTVALYDTDGTTVLGTTIATNGVWSIRSTTLSAGMHSLTAKATDAAGNVSAASAPLRIVIDTSAPTPPPTPVLDASSDSGTSNFDGVTSVVTPLVTGTAEAGSTVTLYDTDGTTARGTAIATHGVWSIRSTTLSEGAHFLTAKATDAAGNVSPASAPLRIVIDTSAPAAPPTPVLDPLSETGASVSDGITSVTTPLITGTAEAGSTVTLYDTDGVTVLGTAAADATDGRWSIQTTSLSEGAHSLTARATDAAGNVSAASAALGITVDTSAPTAPPPPVLDALSDSGASNFDGITSVVTPLVTGTAEVGSTVVLYDTDGVTVLGTAIATHGVWSIQSTTLSEGSHSLTARATDAAGNVSAASAALSITVDTIAPAAPPTPVLDPLSETGASVSDGITSVTTPLITGTAEAGSTVVLYDTDGVTVLGTATADATDGRWSIQTISLSEGTHSLTARATDAAGNVSAASAALSITVDTSAPTAPPTPVLDPLSETGASVSDGITSVVTPLITGTAEVGSTVVLYDTDGVTVLGTAIATHGVWSIRSTTLSEGAHSLTAKATDAAGNVSAAGAALSITVDTIAPVAPPTPVLDPLSETGASVSDGITSVVTPLITGTAEAGSTIVLYDTDGITVLGTAIATNGVWSIRSTTLSEGAHSLTAKAIDAAGNVSAAGAALSITVDTTAPAAPPTPVLDALSDSGASNFDGITSIATPLVTGTAEEGSTVVLYDTDGTTALGTAIATHGVWSIRSTTLSEGTHSLTFRATDAAGNVSAASAVLSITVDTTAPAAPPTPVLDPLSETDTSVAAGIISVTTPLITGTAQAGSTIALYDTDGVTVLGTATADATDGRWSIRTISLSEGTHSLTARATDAAGNASAASAALDVTIDIRPPSATITVEPAALKAGDTAKVTIAFSEAVYGFSNDDLSVAHGTLSAVSSADGGMTWTAIFTPGGNVEQSGNIIRLSSATVSDAAGNGNSAAESGGYSIDAKRPTATIIVANTALRAGETAQVEIVFSEAVKGLDLTDFTVENGTLSDMRTLDGITWTATLTPPDGVQAEANLIRLNNAGYSDLAGNAGVGETGSDSYAVATIPPSETVTAPVATPATPDTAGFSFVPVQGEPLAATSSSLPSPNSVGVGVGESVMSQSSLLATAWAGLPDATRATPEAGLPDATRAAPEAGLPDATRAAPEAGLPGATRAAPEAGLPGATRAAPEAGFPSATRAASEPVAQSTLQDIAATPYMPQPLAASSTVSEGLQLLRSVNDLTVSESGRVDWRVPANVFGHTNPLAGVSVSMTMADGSPLPQWIKFDARTGTLQAQLPENFRGELVLVLTARDDQGKEVKTTVKLKPQAQNAARAGVAEQFQRAALQRAGNAAAQRLHA